MHKDQHKAAPREPELDFILTFVVNLCADFVPLW
jgi:hypothetical protein